jgi:CopG family nickel-responsive transcriptional regulator
MVVFDLPIVAISMSDTDLSELEKLLKDGGFSSRSEVVRHSLQSLLAEHRALQEYSGNISTIITTMYSEKGKDSKCNQVQHEFSRLISAMLHAHSSNGTCVEVMVVNGNAEEVRAFVQKFRSQKRVSRLQVSIAGR